MFSSLKRSRLLADRSCLGIDKMRLHVSLFLLTYAGSMPARLRTRNCRDALDMAVQCPGQARAMAA